MKVHGLAECLRLAGMSGGHPAQGEASGGAIKVHIQEAFEDPEGHSNFSGQPVPVKRI